MKAHKRKPHANPTHTGKSRNRRRRTPPGTPPGTLVADPNSPHPTIRIFAYGPDAIAEHTVNNPQQVRDFLDKWPVLWVDVEGLGHAETIRELGEMFAIHHLALEDVLNVHQRPKVEPYGDYHFIVTRMARFNGRVETEQLTLFLGENFVLTFQEGQPGDCLDVIRERIRQRRGRIREAGLDYLAYALLDSVVDGYFPILEEYGERLETLEDEIVTQPSNDTVARIHEIRRDLLTVRRAMWPQREMFNALLREELEMVTNETRLYLRDCYDHTTQIIDLVETYRELGADLTDVYLSSISNRTNEIMRVLPVIATIFIPLTFIAGVYGMNFNTSASPLNMPELNWALGYPLVLLLMSVIAVAQLAFFRTRGWLGSPKAASRVEKKDPNELVS